jgi:hypothetical protein
MRLRPIESDLLRGRRAIARLPITLDAYLSDLRPRFLHKGGAGRGHRYVARNGRILLATERPLEEWMNCLARVRLQPWHRAILPGDRPEPWGLLIWISPITTTRRSSRRAAYRAQLVKAHDGVADLALDVGGGLVLEFKRCRRNAPESSRTAAIKTARSK